MRIKIKKNTVYITVISVLLLLAIFFKFALKGYSFLSLVLLFIALVVGAYFVLSMRSTKLFKKLRWILTSLVILLIILMTISEIPVISHMRKRERSASQYCIVLGAGVHGTTPSRVLNQRINAAYDFLTEHPDTVAILSGGQGPGEDITEAQCMKDRLISKGIDESRLYMEDRSTSTEENVAFSRKIIESLSGSTDEVTIISSDTHLYRACLIAKEAGFKTVKGYYAYTDYHVLRFTYMLREGVAVWKEWIF